ncbi:MAG: hypothetical protein OXT67_01950 [Zetaproteobacteria bacterium]|nr:hypothetical protein [Zetaproteobacteria bacterium]
MVSKLTQVELPKLWCDSGVSALQQLEATLAAAQTTVLLVQPNMTFLPSEQHLSWRRDAYRMVEALLRLADLVHENPHRYVYIGEGTVCPHVYACLARQCGFILWKGAISDVWVSSKVTLRELIIAPYKIPFDKVSWDSLTIFLCHFVQDLQPWSYPRIAEFGQKVMDEVMCAWLRRHPDFVPYFEAPVALEPPLEEAEVLKVAATVFEEGTVESMDTVYVKIQALSETIPPSQARTSLMAWYLAKKLIENVRQLRSVPEFSNPLAVSSLVPRDYGECWLIYCAEGFPPKAWISRLLTADKKIHLVHSDSLRLVSYVEKVAILIAHQHPLKTRNLTWSNTLSATTVRSLILSPLVGGQFEVTFRGEKLLRGLALGGLSWNSPDFGAEIIWHATSFVGEHEALLTELQLLLSAQLWVQPQEWDKHHFVTPVIRAALLSQIIQLCAVKPHTLKSIMSELELSQAPILGNSEVWEEFLLHQFWMLEEVYQGTLWAEVKDDIREFGKWKHVQKKVAKVGQGDPQHSMLTHSVSYLTLFAHTLVCKLCLDQGSPLAVVEQVATGLVGILFPHTLNDQLYLERLPNLRVQRRAIAEQLWPEFV